MMKRTTALMLMVVCGVLLSDIKSAQGLKCIRCDGCDGKEKTELECASGGGADPICYKSITKDDHVNKGCVLKGAEIGKCDAFGETDMKLCYCDTDLCNNAPTTVTGYSKRLLLFCALTSSVATYFAFYL